MRRKNNISLLAVEVAVPIGLPLVAVAGIYLGAWDIAVFGVVGAAGYFLGLWSVKRKAVKTARGAHR
jgi:hypothetical protein